MGGPLAGVRIIDISTILMGPLATQVVADLGAEVIKIESLGGDDARYLGNAPSPGIGPNFIHINRWKKSLAVDLKRPEGREIVLRLAETCDALLSNIRPAALGRLGLDYAAFKARNPKLVYVSLVGYGRGGRYAAKPAYDDLVQAVSGIPMLMQRALGGEPRYVPLALADRVVGLQGTNMLLAGLLNAQRTGVGQEVELPMFETMVQFVMGEHLNGQSFDPPTGPYGYPRLLSPNRKPFATRDGYIGVLPYNDAQWTRFFAATGHGDLMTHDERFSSIGRRAANIDALYGLVAEILVERTTAEWLAILEEADIPAMPLHTLESIEDDPHLKDVGFFQTVDHPLAGRMRTMPQSGSWSETPIDPAGPAPALGQHTRAILAEAGYADDEVERLIGDGVVATAD
ncbi:CaiB/BaiF CoA-transferase family protein [Phenylobacterium sp.]|uniref:CaiB/BaiF CoA transferase family protein n=1 Tax=Phenylobacterium sp. TaxID=1871053 RepID=UPI002735090C|nr:CoA transferase [Phenylobacterium sp.]MDP3661004.1 CoA transferase [Phenylobacterium sp.]